MREARPRMHLLVSVALVTASCLCAAPISAVAAQGGVVVRGTVTIPSFNRDQRPEPDIEVALVNAAGERRSVVTNIDGVFEFPQIPPGQYTLRIDLPQYVAYRQEITVGATAPPDVAIKLAFKTEQNTQDFIRVRDRWRIGYPSWQRYAPDYPGEYPYVRGRGLDPYDQNVLKGDLPIIGQDIFFILTAISETPLEFRALPTPSGVSAEDPGSEEFFGENRQYAVLPSGIFSFELFKGDTAFRPRDWALKITPVFNLNYVNVREKNVLNISPEEGNKRRRQDLGLQEAFGELKLFDVGDNFDFVSVRAGIQPFNSDFRGFLFRDNNLGVRLFGNVGTESEPVEPGLLRPARKGNEQRAEPARAAEAARRDRQLLPPGLPHSGLHVFGQRPRQSRSWRGVLLRRERIPRASVSDRPDRSPQGERLLRRGRR